MATSRRSTRLRAARGREGVGAGATACPEGAGPPAPGPPQVSGRAAVTWRVPRVFSGLGACFGEPLGPTAVNPRGSNHCYSLTHSKLSRSSG